MAHWPGKVMFSDGTIKYIEYNGTADVCLPKLFSTEEELRENWHSQDNDNTEVECKHLEEEVQIITPFNSWKGKACRNCNRLVEDLRLPDDF
jgi:hypothetical protein